MGPEKDKLPPNQPQPTTIGNVSTEPVSDYSNLDLGANIFKNFGVQGTGNLLSGMGIIPPPYEGPPPNPALEDVQGSVVASQAGQYQSGSSQVIGGGVQPHARPLPQGKKDGTGYTLVGTLEPGATPEEKQLQEEAQAQILEHKKYLFLVAAKQAKISQAELQGFGELAATNAVSVARIVDEELPKYTAKMRELYDELDAIKTLRVNPYQYLQQAGAGGRAGAVLATAVSQIAAGAGNANTARAALRTSIEADIDAQMQNIDLQYKSIEARRANVFDQVALMEEQILFRDKMLAYAWESVSAIIKSAQQGAASEAAYVGYNLLEHYANLEKIAANVAYRAKVATIHVRKPLMNAVHANRELQRVGRFQGELENVFKTGVQQGTAMAQQQQGQRQQGTASVQSRRLPSSTADAKIAPEFKADMAFSLEEADPAGPDAGPSVSDAGPRGRVGDFDKRFHEMTARWDVEEDTEGLGTSVYKDGSIGQRIANQVGDFIEVPRNPDAAAMVINNPFKYFSDQDNMVKHIRDANFVVQMMKEAGGPPRSNEDAYDMYKHIEDHPEVLEADVSYEEQSGTGKNVLIRRNTHDSEVFGKMRWAADSSIRFDKAAQKDKLTTLQDEEKVIKQVYNLIDTLKKAPIGSILGVLKWNAEEKSWNVGAFDAESRGQLNLLNQRADDLGIGWYKTRDPAGRLSDQDLNFFREIIGVRGLGWKDRLVDTVNTIYRGGNPSVVKDGIIAALSAMAADAEKNVASMFSDDLILSGEAKMQQIKRRQENYHYYRKQKEFHGESEK